MCAGSFFEHLGPARFLIVSGNGVEQRLAPALPGDHVAHARDDADEGGDADGDACVQVVGDGMTSECCSSAGLEVANKRAAPPAASPHCILVCLVCQPNSQREHIVLVVVSGGGCCWASAPTIPPVVRGVTASFFGGGVGKNRQTGMSYSVEPNEKPETRLFTTA